MPTYEYKCVECDERFEVEQSMSARPLTRIKGDDHNHKVKKVFSPIGIAFKGSGFYKNDSAGKKKSSPTSSSSESKSDTTSDSKADSTAGSKASSSDSGSKKSKSSDSKASSS